MGKNENKVLDAQDPLGIARFAEIKERFGDPTKIPKVYKNRFDNIVSIFTYRTGVEHELQRAKEKYTPHWELYQIEERLKKFKSAEFFCDALQALLDEKRKDEASKAAKPKPYDTGGWGRRW